MNRTLNLRATALRVLALGSLVLLAACERPPMESVQHGYRGTGMVQVYNPRTLDDRITANELPVALPAADPGGQKASQIYKNVQVLGNLSAGQFTRLMASMTTWVSPEEGCTYCHNPANFAEDSKYTKIVARRMIQMTQTINTDWQPHVAQTGVTCWTCHRGNPVPKEIWFTANHQPQGSNFIGDKAGQNDPSPVVNLSTLPNDPFTPFLLEDKPIRVGGTTALPSGNRSSIKQAEWTYGLMVHFSQGLGVNCTYCHNSQNFGKWEGGPPQRVTAWHGIRMVRELNNKYMEPLTDVFPVHRKGELGDVAKANCATCHNGAYKPLNGQSMLKDFPELASRPPEVTAAVTGKAASGASAAPAKAK
ncbi:MAG: Photosynthetic reaction center cytochrome c subunit precursor [Pseudomonadota bacterium]|jgi:photosynthetic reaction center cytochrome c subunit